MTRKRTKKVGPAAGLGVRYGSSVRKKYIRILLESRKSHKCPYCDFETVRRESVGVWKCNKCNQIFAGGAYTPTTKLGIVAKRATKSVSS